MQIRVLTKFAYSVIFLFSSINQAKTHKYEFEHFIYEKKNKAFTV